MYPYQKEGVLQAAKAGRIIIADDMGLGKTIQAIVLTGTPLENKLDELHSIVEFVNPYKLGALFRFLDKHQIKEEATGKVIGYQKLNQISKVLSEILVRRTKKEILDQLPERIDKNYFVDVTKEQWDIHQDYENMVSRLVHKWRRFGFLTEQDRQRLLIALSSMRMVSDSTFILDQETRYDRKIDELLVLLKEIFESGNDKVVIFSQWERMTRLVARELRKMNIGFEYLHGGVPGVKRKDLIVNFKKDPEKRVFLSTDAGGVGLNLQSANVIMDESKFSKLMKTVEDLDEFETAQYLEKDKETGKTSIKIPVQNEEAITNTIKTLSSIFAGLVEK